MIKRWMLGWILAVGTGTLAMAQEADSSRCSILQKLVGAFPTHFVELAQQGWQPASAKQVFYQVKTNGSYVPITQLRMGEDINQAKADGIFGAWMTALEQCRLDSIGTLTADGYAALLAEPGDVVITYKPVSASAEYATLRFALRRTQIKVKPARYHVSISCYQLRLPEKKQRS